MILLSNYSSSKKHVLLSFHSVINIFQHIKQATLSAEDKQQMQVFNLLYYFTEIDRNNTLWELLYKKSFY